jgi:type II secretory pathway pseudopilin PulG
MTHRNPWEPAGTTLIEVLVATSVLATGLVAIAQLFLIAAASNRVARDTTVAATLAAQKVEQLLLTEPSQGTGDVDHVDEWGNVVGTSGSPPANAMYTRRWSFEPLSGDRVAIRVRVGRSVRSGQPGYLPGEVRLFAIKTRRHS